MQPSLKARAQVDEESQNLVIGRCLAGNIARSGLRLVLFREIQGLDTTPPPAWFGLQSPLVFRTFDHG
jgi:hypothetical protein